MRSFWLIIVPICCGFWLQACGSYQTTDGGTSSVVYTNTETYNDPVRGQVTETKSVTTAIAQPENPSSPGTLITEIKPDGTVTVKGNTGNAQNTAGTFAAAANARYIMYAGIGLIVLGLAAGLILKNWIWAAIIMATGVGMTILSYLLVQYAIWFLGGFAILVIYGCYLVWDLFKNKKANKENVELIQEGKKQGVINAEKFAQIANLGQSDSTKSLVKKTKKELEKKNAS